MEILRRRRKQISDDFDMREVLQLTAAQYFV